jgi:hypothetical protein
MSAIITEKFRLHNAAQFEESFSETASDTYYTFIGKSSPFTTATSGGSDISPPIPVDSVGETEYYAWDSMIGAKKLTVSDVHRVIPRRNWSNSTVFDMYRHDISSSNTSTSGASSLYDSSFYFMTTDFNVYKVLDNNGGTAYSGVEPTSTATAPFSLGGYLLQYMYTITSSDAQKFVTTDFIPVQTDSTVSAAATDGAIDNIVITAGGSSYSSTPTVTITGDGSGATASATVAGNAVTGITITDNGSGYTFATVTISGGGGTGATAEAIISPKGGHGFDAVAELGGHFVMTATTLTAGESDDFTTANDFRQIGLVVNPTNFGTATIASASTARQTFAIFFQNVGGAGDFVIDEEINQASTNAVGKVVEWDSTSRILFYQQERFSDFGTHTDGSAPAFSGANAITGQTSGTTRTPDTTASSVTFGSTTITLTSGYANPELQPDSGNIVYLEQRRPINRNTDQSEDIRLIIEF